MADGRELEDLKIRNIFFCCLLLKSIKTAKMFLFRGTNELMGSLIAAKVYRNIARLLDVKDSQTLQIKKSYTELAE